MSDFNQLPQIALFKDVFTGGKFKLFSQYLNPPPFVGDLSHTLNYEFFQRGQQQLSGLLPGMKSMTKWVHAHLHTAHGPANGGDHIPMLKDNSLRAEVARG